MSSDVPGQVAAFAWRSRDRQLAGSRGQPPVDSPMRDARDELAAADRGFIKDWAAAFRFNPYRNYRALTQSDAARLAADAASVCGPDVMHLWRRDGGVPLGMLRIVDLAWDTELYGRRMGRITHVCGELDSDSIRALVDQTDFAHLAVRVDASDVATQRALTRAGFYPADSMLTYLYDPGRGELPESPACRATRNYRYRLYEPSDRESVLRITAHCYARYAGRYHTDAWLAEKGPERYVRWAERCVDGHADQICIAESSKGRVVGYIAFRYDRRMHRLLGISCYGGAALGASRGGDYHSLLRCTLECPKAIPMHFAECQTQIDNYHVHRVYHALGLEYVRAEHTYHLQRG